MIINTPIPVADLFDKISILEIKYSEIKGNKNIEIQKELDLLLKIAKENKLHQFLNSLLYKELKNINQKLWDICDERRKLEHKKIFNDYFIEISRNEYKVNDNRAEVKMRINKFFNSYIQEIKSYNKFSHLDD